MTDERGGSGRTRKAGDGQDERDWPFWARLQGDAACGYTAEALRTGIGPYAVICRQSGTGGRELARMVAEELGWDRIDGQRLDGLVKQFRSDGRVPESLRSQNAQRFDKLFGDMEDQPLVARDEYGDALARIILLAGLKGRVVLVGRGAHLVLPPERGLSVLLIGSESYRIEHTARQRGLAHDEAARHVRKVDRARRGFVRRYFEQDPADPNLYDLLINVERLGREHAAALIVAAVDRRCRRR